MSEVVEMDIKDYEKLAETLLALEGALAEFRANLPGKSLGMKNTYYVLREATEELRDVVQKHERGLIDLL